MSSSVHCRLRLRLIAPSKRLEALSTKVGPESSFVLGPKPGGCLRQTTGYWLCFHPWNQSRATVLFGNDP
jgi:hypothetical protein